MILFLILLGTSCLYVPIKYWKYNDKEWYMLYSVVSILMAVINYSVAIKIIYFGY